jgi:hypothetical protein
MVIINPKDHPQNKKECEKKDSLLNIKDLFINLKKK